ncbi:MAG: hypothetical protein PHE84_13620 [bacterium]|nr:hypothetical protein [bacterium]
MRKKYLRAGRLFCLIGVLVFLSACVNVEEKIFLNLDGSGRMDVRYVLKREFFQLVPKGPGTMFPVSEADVYKMFENTKGVKVEGAKLVMDDKNVSLQYVLKFDDISTFNNDSYRFTLEKDGNNRDFHVWIKGGGAQQNLKNDELKGKIMTEAINQAMAMYNIKITVVLPAPIVKSNAQEVQDRTATWVVPIWELQKKPAFDLDAQIKVRKGLWDRIKDIF